jgi:hypothetical protein
MNDDVNVTLDSQQNCFVVQIGNHTIPMPPPQFEQLIQKALAAAAQALHSYIQETGRTLEKGQPSEALLSTCMDAHADLSAQQILTRMRIGPIALNFACTREVAIEYCAQVMELLQNADEHPSGRMS